MVSAAARSKPGCRPLPDRIARVRRQADLASQHTDEALLRAAEAHNLAALFFDGCQVAIIAHCTPRNHAEALRLTEASATPTAWEEAVAACMKVICLTWADWPTNSPTAAMVNAYLALTGHTVAALAVDTPRPFGSGVATPVAFAASVPVRPPRRCQSRQAYSRPCVHDCFW